MQGLAREHPVLLAALAEGHVVTKSVTLQLAKWTRAIPEEYRGQAEEIVMAAARAGADLRALAAICAEIRCRTAPPDQDPERDPGLDRGLCLDTTIDGAGVLRGDLTPACAAKVQAVLDALAAPHGGDDLRTRSQRLHDALEDAVNRLLASDLLPRRAGQPVKALVHVHFSELLDLDEGSALQDKWIADYRARWSARRAAASIGPGDGGAWLDGNTARAITADAMIVPVVSGDIDPGAVEELVGLCVRYHHTRSRAAAGRPGDEHQPDAAAAERVAEVLARLEQQILAKVLQVVSGPGGAASFLRRELLGKGLNGPSLPLDVGHTDEIPVHLRRLVALRDQGCRFPGGCGQPASGCEPHHVTHRADGGRTSLGNLQDWCWWHHHVVLHQMGWQLTAHPDGTSHVKTPDDKVIRSHSPPTRAG
ncbi:MAG: DUF222 domain-containing protein [Streptosporangiaceae bacterium]|nr:DUF222 domain-containing protein [Streptosporangiaceae bacterium]